VVAIESVTPIDEADITAEEVRAAGLGSLEELRAELGKRPGVLYRIALRYLGADPRIALRDQNALSPGELADLKRRLERLDTASRLGPWTTEVLRLLHENPGVRAGDLATRRGQETPAFKRDVRKLKELVLTESLETGYLLPQLRGGHAWYSQFVASPNKNREALGQADASRPTV
jgi:hypothetical protein